MAKRRMAELRAGERLVVLATDPEAPIDIGAWAASEGHAFDERRLEGWTEFRLVKAAGATPQGSPPRRVAGRRRRRARRCPGRGPPPGRRRSRGCARASAAPSSRPPP